MSHSRDLMVVSFLHLECAVSAWKLVIKTHNHLRRHGLQNAHPQRSSWRVNAYLELKQWLLVCSSRSLCLAEQHLMKSTVGGLSAGIPASWKSSGVVLLRPLPAVELCGGLSSAAAVDQSYQGSGRQMRHLDCQQFSLLLVISRMKVLFGWQGFSVKLQLQPSPVASWCNLASKAISVDLCRFCSLYFASKTETECSERG